MLDVRDVTIAPDEDDLGEASPVVRMRRVRLGSWYDKRRNKDCIFQLRAFSRRRDRRMGTIRRMGMKIRMTGDMVKARNERQMVFFSNKKG